MTLLPFTFDPFVQDRDGSWKTDSDVINPHDDIDDAIVDDDTIIDDVTDRNNEAINYDVTIVDDDTINNDVANPNDDFDDTIADDSSTNTIIDLTG